MKNLVYFTILVLLLGSCGTTKNKTTTPVRNSQPGTINNNRPKSDFHSAFHDYLVMNYDGALSEAATYTQRAPQDDAGFYLLSKIYIIKGDSVNSLKAMEQAHDLDKNNKWYSQILGKAYLGNREYTKALNIYQSLDKQEPNNTATLLGLYQTYYGLKQYKNCLQTLDKITDLQGENPGILTQKYMVLIDKKDYKDAEQLMLDGIKKYPDDPQILFALNDYYTATKQREKLVPILQSLIAQDDENSNAQLLLADFYLQKGEVDQAENYLTKVFSNNDEDPSTKQLFMLDNFINKKNIPNDLAIKLSQLVLKNNPSDSFFNLLLGNVYDQDADPEKALPYYKKGLEQANNKKEPLMRIVFLEYKNKEYDSLVKYASQGLELFPAEHDLYYFKALGLLKTKQYQPCIDIVNEGIIYLTDHSDIADFYSIKAEAQFGLKQFDEGKKSYQKAINETKDNDYLKINLALVMAKNKLDLPEAMSWVEQVLKTKPNDPNARYTKGFILFQQKDYEKARAIFETLIVTNPKDASVWNSLGDVMYQLGKVDEAVKDWENAKEMKLNSPILDKKISDKKYYEEDN